MYPFGRDVRDAISSEILGPMFAKDIGDTIVWQFWPAVENRIQPFSDFAVVGQVGYLQDHERQDGICVFLLLGVFLPRFRNLSQLVSASPQKDRRKISRFVGHVEVDRIFQKARFLNLL